MTLCRKGLHPYPGKGRCRPCGLERMARWRRANPERYQARIEAWRLLNREYVRRYRREYHAANSVRQNALNDVWYAANRPRALRQMAERRRRGSYEWWLRELEAE